MGKAPVVIKQYYPHRMNWLMNAETTSKAQNIGCRVRAETQDLTLTTQLAKQRGTAHR